MRINGVPNDRGVKIKIVQAVAAHSLIDSHAAVFIPRCRLRAKGESIIANDV